MERIKLGNIVVEIVQKDIKNLHLSVYPPAGRVRISAPLRMNPDTIRIYAISKLSWIKRQQARLRDQIRDSEKDYISRESHYFLGKRYLMKIKEAEGSPKLELQHGIILFQKFRLIFIYSIIIIYVGLVNLREHE